MILGCSAVYGVLLGVGQLIYGEPLGFTLIGLAGVSAFGLTRLWK